LLGAFDRRLRVGLVTLAFELADAVADLVALVAQVVPTGF
jgi:hypothetical protein